MAIVKLWRMCKQDVQNKRVSQRVIIINEVKDPRGKFYDKKNIVGSILQELI